jgi:phytoene dehydrogenase-like protein
MFTTAFGKREQRGAHVRQAAERESPALARYLRRSADKNSEAGQHFPKRMAPEWLGGFELRRLNAFQAWQRLPAFQLEFDPAFQNLTQCLRGLVARFAISPRSGKTAQLGVNFRTVVDLLVPRVL